MAKAATEDYDLKKVVDGMREELVILRGELEAARVGNKLIVDRETAVAGVLERHSMKRKSGGKLCWFIKDSRYPESPEIEFWTDATTQKGALRDYQERTGMAWVGAGSDPFKATLATDKAKEVKAEN